jgi:hypothetical protein
METSKLVKLLFLWSPKLFSNYLVLPPVKDFLGQKDHTVFVTSHKNNLMVLYKFLTHKDKQPKNLQTIM